MMKKCRSKAYSKYKKRNERYIEGKNVAIVLSTFEKNNINPQHVLDAINALKPADQYRTFSSTTEAEFSLQETKKALDAANFALSRMQSQYPENHFKNLRPLTSVMRLHTDKIDQALALESSYERSYGLIGEPADKLGGLTRLLSDAGYKYEETIAHALSSAEVYGLMIDTTVKTLSLSENSLGNMDTDMLSALAGLKGIVNEMADQGTIAYIDVSRRIFSRTTPPNFDPAPPSEQTPLPQPRANPAPKSDIPQVAGDDASLDAKLDYIREYSSHLDVTQYNDAILSKIAEHLGSNTAEEWTLKQNAQDIINHQNHNAQQLRTALNQKLAPSTKKKEIESSIRFAKTALCVAHFEIATLLEKDKQFKDTFRADAGAFQDIVILCESKIPVLEEMATAKRGILTALHKAHLVLSEEKAVDSDITLTHSKLSLEGTISQLSSTIEQKSLRILNQMQSNKRRSPRASIASHLIWTTIKRKKTFLTCALCQQMA